MTTYAVGDIQGCFDTFAALLDALSFSPSRDELWLVGDLVNRGPKSLEMLRWAKRNSDSIRVVLGNHDVHLLARAASLTARKKRDTLDDVLQARDAGSLLAWLRTQEFCFTSGRFAVVHAGLLPSWSIDDALFYNDVLTDALRERTWKKGLVDVLAHDATAVFTRLRTCTAAGVMHREFDGPPADAPPGYHPWFVAPRAPWQTHRVVFGHWSALGLSLTPHAIGLDTGCVWGRELTAIVPRSRRVVAIASREPNGR